MASYRLAIDGVGGGGQDWCARCARRGRGRKHPSFFYCQLGYAQKERIGDVAGGGTPGRYALGCAHNVIALYGLQEFLADVDRDRQFWRESSGVVSAILNWAANEGFPSYMEDLNPEALWSTAHEFRQRYMLNSLASLMKLIANKGPF